MRLILVDGLNLVRRIFAGVPDAAAPEMHTRKTLATVGASLDRLLHHYPASHGAGVFDAPPPTWRHQLHDGYKAGRPAMPTRLAEALSDFENVFERAGLKIIRAPGFEADDVIATISTKAAGRGARVLIVSTDKSLLMLLGENIAVRNHFADQNLTAATVHERFGIPAARLATYLALVGDPGQGIPGVPGIGPKAAAQLIRTHHHLDTMLEVAQEQGRLYKLLQSHRREALLSLQLATLRTDVDIGINLRDYRLQDYRLPTPL
ncbi:MAG: hypothetical protein GKR94_10105 [Gammaproteobacteria bacterium]|nr:hypothetical protein [Gammaproteobacteria bacterium]